MNPSRKRLSEVKERGQTIWNDCDASLGSDSFGDDFDNQMATFRLFAEAWIKHGPPESLSPIGSTTQPATAKRQMK